jgi:hypothetical protein
VNDKQNKFALILIATELSQATIRQASVAYCPINW